MNSIKLIITNVPSCRKTIHIRNVIIWIALSVGAILMLFPFLWTFVTSITPDGTLDSTPSLIVTNPTFSAYTKLSTKIPIIRILLNSFFIAIITTLLQLLTSSMAAYAFSRFEFKGKKIIFAGYLATMMVPLQVLVVPLFIMMTRMQINDSYFSLILPNIASVFGVFMLKQATDGIPKDLDEAARIDGASNLRIWWKIIIPLTKPSLAALTIFSFMDSWNSFLWPLVVIRSPELMTLPLGLSLLKGQFTTEWNVVMAGSVVSILPILIVYLFAQKQFVAGMAHVGIK